MVIDTSSQETMVNGLTRYFEIDSLELIYKIIQAGNEALNGIEFNLDIFNAKITNFIKEKANDKVLDYMYFYHLTRRLKDNDENYTCYNLKQILITDNSLTDFLKKHNIEFKECDNKIDIYHNNKKINLDDSNNNYLKKRIGLYEIKDYCVNGFAIRHGLEFSGIYYNYLVNGCEFIINLLEYINEHKILDEYKKNSIYYCYTYKISTDDVIFDKKSSLKSKKDKTIHLICSICYCIYSNLTGNTSFDNIIIRVDDNMNINESSYIKKEKLVKQ